MVSTRALYIVHRRIQEPTGPSKQPIRTRYLDHVTDYQPIRDQYFLVRSVPGTPTRHAHVIAQRDMHCNNFLTQNWIIN